MDDENPGLIVKIKARLPILLIVKFTLNRYAISGMCLLQTPVHWSSYLCYLRKNVYAIPPCSISNDENEGYGSKVTWAICWLDSDRNEVSDDNFSDKSENVDGTSENVDDVEIRDKPSVHGDIIEASDEDDKEEIADEIPKKRRALTVKQKVDIIDYARKTSIHAASRCYKVDRKSLRDWKKSEKTLRNM